MNCKRVAPPPKTIANALMLAISQQEPVTAALTKYECSCRLEPPLRGDCLAILEAEKFVEKKKEKIAELVKVGGENGEEPAENGESGEAAENGEETPIEVVPEPEQPKPALEKSFSQCVKYIWNEVYRERSGWVDITNKDALLQHLH